MFSTPTMTHLRAASNQLSCPTLLSAPRHLHSLVVMTPHSSLSPQASQLSAGPHCLTLGSSAAEAVVLASDSSCSEGTAAGGAAPPTEFHLNEPTPTPLTAFHPVVVTAASHPSTQPAPPPPHPFAEVPPAAGVGAGTGGAGPGLRLTSADLISYIARHEDLAGSCWVEDDKPRQPAVGCSQITHHSQGQGPNESQGPNQGQGQGQGQGGVIKSLVLLVSGQPWLAVLRAEDRLCERKMAAWLGVARRRVRLAAPEEALAACGYPPGSVPPLGHRQRLSTLVDQGVLLLGGWVRGGGGDPDKDLVVQVTTLLLHSQAQVTDLAVGSPRAWAQVPGSGVEACEGGRVLGAQLPVPWPPGSRVVDLVAVVALKRRVAKVLQFCTLVPALGVIPGAAHAAAAAGQAMFLRRLWRLPDSLEPQGGAASSSSGGQGGGGGEGEAGQQPGGGGAGLLTDVSCEVQLILGKTLERNMGREAAIQVMDSLRSGSVIRVIGVTQPHGPPHDYTPTANSRVARQLVQSAAQTVASTGTARSRARVLDLVAHRVMRLYKSSDRMHLDVSRARRAGYQVDSGPDLLRLLALRQKAASASAQPDARAQQNDATEHADTTSGPGPRHVSHSARSPASSLDGGTGKQRTRSNSSSTATGIPPGPSAPPLRPGLAGLASAAPDPAYWQLPPHLAQAVQWVHDAEGVRALRRLLAEEVREQQQAWRHLQQLLEQPPCSSSSIHDSPSNGSALASSSEASSGGAEGRKGAGGTEVVPSGGGVLTPDIMAEGAGGVASQEGPPSPGVSGHVVGLGAAGLTLRQLLPVAVGLDCEWVTRAPGQGAPPVALMQVALRGGVFLLDMLALTAQQDQGLHAARLARGGTAVEEVQEEEEQQEEEEEEEGGAAGLASGRSEVEGLLTDLLRNPSISLLGFQLQQDVSMLMNSLPRLRRQLQRGGAATPPWQLTPILPPRSLPPPPSPPAAAAGAAAAAAALEAGEELQARSSSATNVTQNISSSSSGLDHADTPSHTGQLPGSSTPDLVSAAALQQRTHACLTRLAACSRPAMALPAPPGYVDVLKLAQLAQLKVQPAAQSPSLAQLVKEVLGRPLDKSMQCSDWAARPLTQAQLQYAATDAACLLALHDALLNLD